MTTDEEFARKLRERIDTAGAGCGCLMTILLLILCVVFLFEGCS